MKGLILKDLYVLTDTLKIYAIIYVVYGYLGIVQGQPGLMYAMVFITSAILPVTSISYDERSRWDRLANTFPTSRKEIVVSKYILALLLLAVSITLTGLAFALADDMTLKEKTVSVSIMLAVSLIYQAITIPLIYKFGSEKGRIVMMCACFLPMIALYLISETAWFNAAAIEAFFTTYGTVIPFVMTAVTAVIYIISVALSVRIYTAKEL